MAPFVVLQASLPRITEWSRRAACLTGATRRHTARTTGSSTAAAGSATTTGTDTYTGQGGPLVSASAASVVALDRRRCDSYFEGLAVWAGSEFSCMSYWLNIHVSPFQIHWRFLWRHHGARHAQGDLPQRARGRGFRGVRDPPPGLTMTNSTLYHGFLPCPMRCSHPRPHHTPPGVP